MNNDDKSSVKTYIQKHHIMNHNNHTNQINHSSDSVRIYLNYDLQLIFVIEVIFKILENRDDTRSI